MKNKFSINIGDRITYKDEFYECVFKNINFNFNSVTKTNKS